MITGIVQTSKTNDYGYTSYKVSSTWYGSDSKGPPRASEGEKVSFEAFDKPGKEGRVFPTIKLATFKKVSGGGSTEQPASSGVSVGRVSHRRRPLASGTRDNYWADKATEDSKRDPRIVYQSSYERAILFVDLAIKNGAFDALAKAKPTSRLEILTALVDEQAERIMKSVYQARVPSSTVDPDIGASGTDSSSSHEAEEVETGEQWS